MLLSRFTPGNDAWLAFEYPWNLLSFDELDRMLPWSLEPLEGVYGPPLSVVLSESRLLFADDFPCVGGLGAPLDSNVGYWWKSGPALFD